MILTKDLVIKEKNNINYPSKIFVNGKYQDSISGKQFENISPINGNVINRISFAQKEDVDFAVTRAREVFQQEIFLKKVAGLKQTQVLEKKLC